MRNIPFSLKIAAKPLLILVLLVILSLIGFSKAFAVVGSLREELATAKVNGNVLESKLDTLSVNQANVEADENYAVSFFPGESSALLALYQLRASAVNSGLVLSNLKVVSGAGTGDFSAVSFSFDLEGPLQQVLDFVNLTKNIAPNVWIGKTKLDFMGDVLKAGIDINSYWAPYPAKMPALTEPITSLDDSEKEILAKISSYSRPSFVSLTAGAPRENLNPFGE